VDPENLDYGKIKRIVAASLDDDNFGEGTFDLFKKKLWRSIIKELGLRREDITPQTTKRLNEMFNEAFLEYLSCACTSS
jgi:hypothetical protein